MPRWISITEDHLAAARSGKLITSAREKNTGADDPVQEAIADAVARVRRAVSAGNKLDADTTAVPGSLKALTVRLATRALAALVGFPLSQDEQDQKRADDSDLNRMTDNRLRVEAPDTPAGGDEMQAIGRPVEAVNVPTRMTGRGRTSGL